MNEKKIKGYSPTDKIVKQVSLISQTKKVSETEEFGIIQETDNIDKTEIVTNTSHLIDKSLCINTEMFLSIFQNSQKMFRYADRNSIGKKFVSGGL